MRPPHYQKLVNEDFIPKANPKGSLSQMPQPHCCCWHHFQYILPVWVGSKWRWFFSSWALLVLKSVGTLPFISKVSITSSRTNPSFRPGSDCDIWRCMIQDRQGIEMAGAADGQDPITQRPFFFNVCSQLCCFCVFLACDGQLWQERKRNEVVLGSQSLVRQILEKPKGILWANLILQNA